MYSRKDEDFLEKRSRENLVETYREELLRILRGYKHMDFIPFIVRRQMRKDGILKRFSGRYTVTQLGMEMLSEEASDRLVKSRGGGEG